MEFWNAFKKWCGSDTTTARCTRTIAQGIVGALIAYLPDLVAGATVIPTEYKALVVALVMAVLSPVQAELGGTPEEEAEENE